jgi:hypothetical protein
VCIGVKTWGEVLEENNARLQFIKEKLEYKADEGRALAHLEEKHREFLEGVLVADDDAQPTANEEIASSSIKNRRRQRK